MSPPYRSRVLIQLAWWNVAFHLVALGLALFGMRPGTPAFPLDERQAYLAGNPPGWSAGWGAWMICALLQVAFYAVLAHHLRDRKDVAWLAVIIATAGAAVDLFCDAVHINILPGLAAKGAETRELFLALELIGRAGGLIVANGFYCTATLLLTLCLRGRADVHPLALLAGYGVFGFGMWLTACGFTNITWQIEAATGPTILCFCAWVVFVAYSLRPGEGKP